MANRENKQRNRRLSVMDKDRWQEIVHTLKANKRRSIATAFGVFWGIFMLVVLVSVSAGFSNGMLHMVRGVSANTGFVYRQQTSKPYKGFRKGRYWTSKLSDLHMLKKHIPELTHVSPMIFNYRRGGNQTAYKDKTGSFSMMGVDPEYFEIYRMQLLQGRFLNAEDERTKRKVCLIGSHVRDRLFGSEDPIGAVIKANGSYFRVVGVVREFGKSAFGSTPSRSIFTSFALQQQILRYGDDVFQFVCTARDNADMEVVLSRIATYLKSRYRIAPDDDKAVGTFNVAQMFKIFSIFFLGLNVLIWIVGIGTLLTGIVGVTNILLVTVRERTREIGVRRALGAKPRNIISQILGESILLTAIAGLAGLVLGILIMSGVAAAFSTPPTSMPFYRPLIPFSTAILSLLIIISGGLLGGILPAFRAIQIKAIDAIRDE